MYVKCFDDRYKESEKIGNFYNNYTCDSIINEMIFNLSSFYRPYAENIFETFVSFDEMKNLRISANELFNCSAKLHFRDESFVSNATIIENLSLICYALNFNILKLIQIRVTIITTAMSRVLKTFIRNTNVLRIFSLKKTLFSLIRVNICTQFVTKPRDITTQMNRIVRNFFLEIDIIRSDSDSISPHAPWSFSCSEFTFVSIIENRQI